MNAQQKVAIENHCRFAFETMHPRHRIIKDGWSVIITLNSGYE